MESSLFEPPKTTQNSLSKFHPVSLSLGDTSSYTMPWHVVVDSESTESSPFTRHKTTYREPYAAARARCRVIDATTEVLIWNPEGEIMEGTLSTPYLNRGGHWETPHHRCGGNLGTTRRWALERNLAKEAVVKKDDLEDGEVIWLSNGVRGFKCGRIWLGRAELVQTGE